MQLRPYQSEACEAVIKYLTTSWVRGMFPLVVLPTAAGKTVVFSTLIQQFHQLHGAPNVLILAHRKELILQAEDKLLAIWPQAPVGVFAAGAGRRELRPITVGSRDTFINVLDARPHFDVVIVDEAHNISKKEKSQYDRIFKSLRATNPDLVVIGFTATPFRLDSGVIYGPGELFTTLVYEANIKTLTQQGYLCKLTARGVAPASSINTDGLRKVAGDFEKAELAKRSDTKEIVESALREWHRLAWLEGRKSTVFFCNHVEHAKHVSDLIYDNFDLDVPVLHGKTAKGEREEILRALHAGEIPGVANVGVLTEGWDCPRISCVALLKATLSLRLYMQMVGRGLRLHDSKDDTLVLDFGGNIQRFGPIDVARPPAKKRAKGVPRTRTCVECNTINQPFIKNCTACGKALYEMVPVICPGCGYCNAAGSGCCDECGHIFINHEATAAEGDIISTSEPVQRPQWYTVSGVAAHAVESQKGNIYLKVTYRCGPGAAFSRNLMLGMPGRAGYAAISAWREITHKGTSVPKDPDQAVAMIAAGNVLRNAHRVRIDLNSRYQDVLEVTYNDNKETIDAKAA